MECNSAGSFRVMALWASDTAEKSSLNFLEHNKWAAVNFSLEEDFLTYVKYKEKAYYLLIKTTKYVK